MKVAIVGGGFAGLAALWHLLQKKTYEVTLFSERGGASSASTGLLHPFIGKSAERSWRADEGMRASLELLEIASKALGKAVFEKSGMLRLAITEEQKKDFSLRSKEDAETFWWDASQVAKVFPEAAKAPGLYIPGAITVYSDPYLEGLTLACKHLGARFEERKVASLQELDAFDRIVLAAGASILEFEECKHLPLKLTKGHSLICRWPRRLTAALGSQGHISPTQDPSFCQIGSTYERHFKDASPDPTQAASLLEKIAHFYPPAQDFQVEEIRAGIRISPKEGYRPIIERIAPNAIALTGFGSRGLLYHSLLAKELMI